MRHRVAGSGLGRPTAHRMLMLRGAVTDLLRYGRIKTTQAKAKEIRRLAEKTISRGKKGTLHQRRQASAFLTDEGVVKKLFDEIAPRYSERAGGYTRLVKTGQRQGDAAQMALLELVE
jgi:large subunit ribosomal protein L17|tara:strand:+ start:2386 stop:2739 length:354 start_codon:yes stop_codon:yes gene_type:complete